MDISININSKNFDFSSNLEDVFKYTDLEEFVFAQKEIAKGVENYFSTFGSLPPKGHMIYILFPSRLFMLVEIIHFTTYSFDKSQLFIHVNITDMDSDLGTYNNTYLD